MKNDPNILLNKPPDQSVSGFATQQQDLAIQKQTMASGNASPVSTMEPVQACVMIHDSQSMASSQPAPKKAQCSFTQLQLSIDKKQHNISTLGPFLPVEIISGFKSNSKQITCTITDLAGPCPVHTNKTFDTTFAKQKSNSELSFPVSSVPFYKIFDNGVFFPWNAKTSVYTVNSNTCNGVVSQKIIVYPDIKLKLDIPLEFAKSRKETEKYTRSKKHIRETKEDEAKLNVTASYSEDGHDWEISTSIAEKFNKIKELVNIADQAFSAFNKAFDETIEITFFYPAGKIHFDFEWKESKIPFKVDYAWHAQAVLDPLIGAQAKIALDEMFLQLCSGPVGKLYAKIKDLLAEFNVKIGLDLTVTGTIKLDGGLSKEVDSLKPVKSGGGITGTIEADLKASASFEVQIIITVEASAEAGIKTGIEAKGGLYGHEGGIDLELKVDFMGVVFYASYQVGGGPKAKKKTKKKEQESSLTAKTSDKAEVTVGAASWDKTIKVV